MTKISPVPSTGWRWIRRHCSSDSAPLCVRTSWGTRTLPTSWRRAPIPSEITCSRGSPTACPSAIARTQTFTMWWNVYSS